jgi:hypothetical protein
MDIHKTGSFPAGLDTMNDIDGFNRCWKAGAAGLERK